MSMDLAKKTFSTQPDYLIAGNAEIVTAVKEASAALEATALPWFSIATASWPPSA